MSDGQVFEYILKKKYASQPNNTDNFILPKSATYDKDMENLKQSNLSPKKNTREQSPDELSRVSFSSSRSKMHHSKQRSNDDDNQDASPEGIHLSGFSNMHEKGVMKSISISNNGEYFEQEKDKVSSIKEIKSQYDLRTEIVRNNLTSNNIGADMAGIQNRSNIDFTANKEQDEE